MFEYGTSSTYDDRTSQRNLTATTNGQIVSERLTELLPGTTYHYRLIVHNRTRDNTSPDATFRTANECVVPKLTHKSVAGAKRVLRRAHCSLGRTVHRHSGLRRGRVVAQRPKPGTACAPALRSGSR
jgi:hypothetical protein